MIKQDIIQQVVERTGLPRSKAEVAVDTIFDTLKRSLARGERIELRGFGVFNVRPRKTGIGRNPRTGTEVTIAPGPCRAFQARQRSSSDRLAFHCKAFSHSLLKSYIRLMASTSTVNARDGICACSAKSVAARIRPYATQPDSPLSAAGEIGKSV